jgi:TctA family transporter
LDVFFQSLSVILQPGHLLMLICGVVTGLSIGILPGLGGIVGMTILLPVIYGMEPHMDWPQGLIKLPWPLG